MPVDILALMNLTRGHFELDDGLHTDYSINKDALHAYPWQAKVIADELYSLALLNFDTPDIVVGPALGGVILAHHVAMRLFVPATYAEKVGTRYVIRRNTHLISGAKVLLVDDVIDTGRTSMAVARAVKRLRGTIIGSVCLVYRGEAQSTWLRCLTTLKLTRWQPNACLLCHQGLPLA
jgi:orotate phosphoribosyltransferase